ncbi:MAG: hypothetical protein C0518_07590 [Opitutus sp.]|nr:hypothetical protein [Opitutus sp.]
MTQRLLLVSILCSVFGAILPTMDAAERAETLRAINLVENPTNHPRRGSKGELGPYQFRSQTWRLHTNRSFNLAVVREHADEIAVKHYEWIKRGLVDAGIDPTPFNIALAWNSGLGAVLRGRVPTVSYNYAERVSNLVEAQHAQRAVAAATEQATVNPPHEARRSEVAAPVVQFRIQPAGPRFAIATAAPLYEPVVLTDKSLPAPLPSAAPRLAIDANAFTFASAATAATPRFALIQ